MATGYTLYGHQDQVKMQEKKGQISKHLHKKISGKQGGPKYISPPFSHHADTWILPNQVVAPFWWIFYDQILSAENVSTLFLKSVAKLSGCAAEMPWTCCSLPR